MSLESYLAPADRKLSYEDVEKANLLISAIIRVCNWKGAALLESSVQGDKALVWVDEHRDRKTSCYVSASSLFKLIDHVRSCLIDRGYEMEKHNWLSMRRSWVIRPKERLTEFYVLPLDVLNAPDEIKEEFKEFRGKLIRVDELPGEFELRSSVLGTFLLYKGHVCSWIFFSFSAFGWFNLTFDRPESPEDYMRERGSSENGI